MRIQVVRDKFEMMSSGNTSIALTRAIVSSTIPNAPVQFRVKREMRQLEFTVNFNGNGGTPQYDSLVGTIGNKVGELPIAIRGTWFFDGWYTSPTGGTLVTENTIVSSSIETLYAHWIEATTLTFNPNGGTLSGSTTILAYVGKPLGISGMSFPGATGPSEEPNCIGFFTDSVSGNKITPDTIYNGTYDVIYPHYAAQSYTINLNDQWFKDDGTGTDPNGKSYGASYSTNPDANEYDGTYISYSNFNVNSGWAKMRITFVGYSEFVVYIRSYAESNYDYTVAGNLDQNITSNPSTGYARTYGKQTSETSISNYTKVTYSNLDGGQHFVDIVFRKDGSVNSSQDRGYVLIPNYRPPVPITITFETDGGSSMDPVQMMSGNKITKPTDPTKTDWYFSGWYSDYELTQRWNFNTIVYENMTLYAKWRNTDLPYDNEVEYLQFDGNGQYINTNLDISSGDIATEFKFQTTQYVNDQHYIGTKNGGAYYHITAFSNKWYWGRNGSEGNGGTSTDIANPHIIKMNVGNYEVYYDDLLLGSGIKMMSTAPLLIGMRDTGTAFLRAKMYYVKIYNRNDSTNVIMDLIPVCKDGIGYMYDKVSRQLFGNSGTGNFILGPDKK